MGKAKQAATKIFNIIEKRTEITAIENGRPKGIEIDAAKFTGEIEFHNVWFRYPTRKNDWVLKGLNLKIRPNETVALVGESGCGKSTIVSLVLRFYDVDYGKITIDGVDIRDYNLKQLRHQMSLVMQEPTLFNYSILENILYGEPQASNSEIEKAAQIANALEFIGSKNLLSEEEDANDRSAITAVKQFTQNERVLIQELGQELYRMKLKELKKIAKDEEKRGVFKAMDGDIDRRTSDKLDIDLPTGFDAECGLRGSKLSGG
jgi:ABC-type cobalamin/Fe3+-siderophores transport system ATPase subunit